MNTVTRQTLAAIVATVALVATPAWSAQSNDQSAVPSSVVAQIKSWASKPLVVESIKKQNGKNASLSQAEIDRLDKQWRAETKATDQPLISSILTNALSAYLKDVKADAAGLYTEIFVMDNKGLNVGQSDVTSDYWQGDEAKWKKTFQNGPDGVLIDEVEFDESSQTYQSQVSVSIVDPATGRTIGAVTVGVDVGVVGG